MRDVNKPRSLQFNALLNSIQQVCAIIFPIITFPYVTRILGAENYGRVNFGYSIVQYFALFAALGISTYAVREGSRIREDKKKISDFASEMFSINVVTTIIACVFLALLILLFDSYKDYRVLILIQGFSIPLATIGIPWVYNIYEDYLYTTLRAISVQVISVVLLFVLVKNPDDYIIYAAITTFASGGANIINYVHARKYVHIRFAYNKSLKKHLVPILLLFANSIAVVIYVNADTTMLKFMQGEFSVGVYSASVKIYSCIKQLLNAILIVTMPRISYYLGKGDNDNYKRLLNNIFSMLVTFLLPASIGLLMISKDLLPIVAGGEYSGGYIALQILSVATFFSLIATFFSFSILIPNRKEKTVLYATVIAAILNIALNFILIPWISYTGAALTTLLAELAVAIITFIKSRELAALVLNKKMIIAWIVGSVLIIIECLIVNTFISTSYIRLTICIILGAVVYFTTFLAFGMNPVKMLKSKGEIVYQMKRENRK